MINRAVLGKLNKSLCICLMLVFGSGSTITAQSTSQSDSVFTQTHFIKGCNVYRSFIIEDLKWIVNSFRILTDSLGTDSTLKEYHYTIFENFLKLIEDPTVPLHKRSKFEIRKLGTPDFDVESRYVKWLGENRFRLGRFSFLGASHFIKPRFPYELDSIKGLWQELEFYQIKKGMKVIDVGTGYGQIPFIFLASGLQIDLTMTDIQMVFLDNLLLDLTEIKTANKESLVQLIKGTSKSLNVEDTLNDRIILRETLHHLQHPKEILMDILHHLKDDGELIVAEQTKEFNIPKKDRCKDAWKKKKILKLLDKQGFVLQEEAICNKSYLFRFHKNLE